jgi:hypothetical protein
LICEQRLKKSLKNFQSIIEQQNFLYLYKFTIIAMVEICYFFTENEAGLEAQARYLEILLNTLEAWRSREALRAYRVGPSSTI